MFLVWNQVLRNFSISALAWAMGSFAMSSHMMDLSLRNQIIWRLAKALILRASSSRAYSLVMMPAR